MTIVSAIVRDTGELVEIGPQGIKLPGRVLAVGLELDEGLTFEQWQGVGECLQGVERSLMWWLGDWLRFGEKKYGETYTKAGELTGRSDGVLRVAKHVAERFPLLRRLNNLGFSHHQEVASLPPGTADELLALASREGLTIKELRQRVSQVKVAAKLPQNGETENCTVADLHGLVARGAKFGTIYADPPWLYDNQGTRAATGNHYDGMTVDDLCALPIGDLAADDAHLHLWTTNAFLFDCQRIFEAWGFEFRSTFVWVKTQIGIGNYWRNSHEFMLTAIRGNAKRFNDHSLRSWLECDRGQHSAKPEQVRSFIERASPGPYLEMFGRRSADGWAVWGNQIERTIFDAAFKEVA